MSTMMLPADSGLPDDLAIGITTFGAEGRANLGVAEASLGRCAVLTPGGPAWYAARFEASGAELRVFAAPQALLEAVAAFGQAREVQVDSGKTHFIGGFWLAEGVSVTVLDPYAPAFRACGASTFLKNRPEDSDWPELPRAWASAIGRAVGEPDDRPGRSDEA